jgi:hypothetical protein
MYEQVPSGKLKVWWNRPAKSSTLTLFYQNAEAGVCTLDVTAPQGGASIEGSPVQITVKPDQPSAARCTAVARSNKRVMTAETGTLMAGTLTIQCYITLLYCLVFVFV